MEVTVLIIYLDILQKLSEAGYNTTRLRREKLLSESVLTRIRKEQSITMDNLNMICKLTGKPVEELVKYIPESSPEEV